MTNLPLDKGTKRGRLCVLMNQYFRPLQARESRRGPTRAFGMESYLHFHLRGFTIKAASKLLKRKILKEVAGMPSRAHQSSGPAAGVIERPVPRRVVRDEVVSRLDTINRTCEQVARAHPSIPARLARELLVIVGSCRINGIDPNLVDAWKAYEHAFSRACERCQRQLSRRREQLVQTHVLPS
jgi:hypothetical protein